MIQIQVCGRGESRLTFIYLFIYYCFLFPLLDHLLSHLIPFCSSVERLVFRDSAIGFFFFFSCPLLLLNFSLLGFLTLSSVAVNCPSLLLLNLQRCPNVTVSSVAEVLSSCPLLGTLLIQVSDSEGEADRKLTNFFFFFFFFFFFSLLFSFFFPKKTNINTSELITTLSNLFPPGVTPSLNRIHVSRITKEQAQFVKLRFGELKIESTGHILDDGP